MLVYAGLLPYYRKPLPKFTALALEHESLEDLQA